VHLGERDHTFDPPPKARRRLCPLTPDRLQHPKDVLRLDFAHGQIGNRRAIVAFGLRAVRLLGQQCHAPLRFRFRVLALAFGGLDATARGVAEGEGRRFFLPANGAAGERILAIEKQSARLVAFLARLLERRS
jgi:hypothetical protein